VRDGNEKDLSALPSVEVGRILKTQKRSLTTPRKRRVLFSHDGARALTFERYKEAVLLGPTVD
jgi:hypothetical protein